MPHTPGPWEIVGSFFDIYQAGSSEYICQSSRSQANRREANARLIAAAPDLLAALVGLMPVAEYEHMTDDDLREEDRLGNGAAVPILAARAAIAKAVG